MVWSLFLNALKLILLGTVVLYAALILITLRTEGTHAPLSFIRSGALCRAASGLSGRAHDRRHSGGTQFRPEQA